MNVPVKIHGRRFLAALALLLVQPPAPLQATAPDAVPNPTALQGTFGKQDPETFQTPPAVHHPQTWFHFIGGNVAKEGVTADLEAIAAAGISGVQFFHGQFGGPWPGVDNQIQCLSEPWDDMVQHVASECRRLGLRFTIQNCPGWAMAGGPWITPDKAMRHLVWSRTDLADRPTDTIALPQPQPSQEDWRDYRDLFVVAFPTPAGDTGKALTPAEVRSNRDDLPWTQCLQAAGDGRITLQPADEPVWVEVTFETPTLLRTVELPSVQSFNHNWCYEPGVTVTVEALLPDGPQTIAHQQMPQSNWQGNRPISLACDEITAEKFRITIEHLHTMTLAYIQLFSGARKNNWEAEAAFVLRGLDQIEHPDQSETAWINPDSILDLSDQLDAQGNLQWDAPSGHWTILRWGHVNSGKRNGPAPPEGTGWECDKLSPTGAETHFAGYVGRLAEGPIGNGLLHGMLLDSWECETQTWTPGLDREFAARRAYELRPWLPALAGFVIEHPETTTRFLRDWRSTINDLLVQNFFGRMAELGHEQGLAIAFETASGDVFPGDLLEYYKHADVPMCEFWHPRMDSFVGSFNFKPIKPCVSAARMYGKPRVAAEAFTSFDLSWTEHPGMLKPIADMHLAEGVTHLVFHTYTHNPRTDFLPPGTAFGSNIGTPFLRQQTWWKAMPEFTDYLARCSFMLERGHPVSDVLWYIGDEQDHKPLQDAPFPVGYRYDYCNPDALLHRLAVQDGRIVTPEGIAYELLWLPNNRRMLPETLERLVTLVEAGAVIVGDRPVGLATLTGGARAQARFDRAVHALWGDTTSDAPRKVGLGSVLAGITIEEALATRAIQPDVQGTGVVWSHRRTTGADWYFVAAPTQPFNGDLTFRATGTVELWDPMTGRTAPAQVREQDPSGTTLHLDLPAAGSLFVVFHKNALPSQAPAATREQTRSIALNGPWHLAFPAGWGAPAGVDLKELSSWTELDVPTEGRAFSGTATYSTSFEWTPADSIAQVVLDLGRVEVLAEISINGQPAGISWIAPHRVDITSLLLEGTNQLEIKVTNTWFNRLVHDAGLPDDARKTWTIGAPPANATLRPAGLLGPVALELFTN